MGFGLISLRNIHHKRAEALNDLGAHLRIKGA
jgi:hypothetical protein